VPIKNQKLNLSAIVFVLLANSSAPGQWHTYTNDNFITDMTVIQNKIYCTTSGGLAIFDKDTQSFVQVLTNTDGLSQNQCLCLAQDKAFNLWVGTDGAGLFIFSPQNQLIQTYKTSELPVRVKAIFISSDTIMTGSENGFEVINTRGTYLNPDDDQVFHFTKTNHPEMLSDNILSFAATDHFWIGTKRGLIRLNRNLDTLVSYPNPFGDSVQAMIVIADTLFITTEAGIAKFNGTGFDTILSLQTPVQDLVFHHDNFYLATNKGLIRYNQQTIDTIWKEPTQTILIDSLLYCGMGGSKDLGYGMRVVSDTIDTLWTSFYSIGLVSNSIFSIVTDNFGEIYTCHGLQGVSRLNTYGDWSAIYSPLYSARILAKDSHNRIWLGHFSFAGGLSCYDPQTNSWSIIQWGQSTARNIINALGIDRNDTKWVWSVRNNFGVIGAIDTTGNEIEFNFGIFSPPGREGSYEFAFDSRKRVWLGTTQGLLMFDYKSTLFNPADDSWVIFTKQSGLPGVEVVSIAVDAKDRIWIGTANGAGVLANDTFTSITTPLSNDIKKVRVDEWGVVWFLTARGLSRYNPNTRQWINYTQGNSQIIPNPDPINLTSFYTCLNIDSRNGFLLVGTQAGLSKFELVDTLEPSFQTVRVFPNPCIKGFHHGVTFDSLPSGSRVLIYSLSGKLITELQVNRASHQAFFDAEDIQSGIYLAVIISPFGNEVEKFAIIH
jgi:ligand-binding sensor domain-containing protein